MTKRLVKSCEECDDQAVDTMGMFSIREKMWYAFLQEKTIILNGDIDESLIEKAVIQVYNFNEVDSYNEQQIKDFERTPIKIYINSSGGLMDEAFSLISAIETSRTPVATIALGKAMSAGFLILLAGHYRYAQIYSRLMYHQGSGGMIGEFNRMIEYAKHWENCQSMVEDYVIRKTKIKKKKLQDIFSHKQDWYLNSAEAIELGIIQGIWTAQEI